nr:hypothetical protein [Tanacetum cinerariifolium]
IERAKVNCTLDDTLQQASTSGTQSNNAPVYDSDGSTKGMVDMGKALDASLVVTESSETESKKQDTSSKSGDDADVDNADIRQHHTEQPEIITEGTVDQYNKQCSINKTRSSNNLVEQKRHIQKPVRKIIIGYRFSPNKTSAVYEKTSPRFDLRWKPTGRIFNIVGLRWVPMGKILASCTSKDDNKLTHGSNVDIPNIYERKQSLDLSAGTSTNVQKEQSFDFSACTSFNVKQENLRVWLLKRLIS